LEAQICIGGVFSILYLNVYARFARKFVKIESENFVDCNDTVVCNGLRWHVNSIRQMAPQVDAMLINAENTGNAAVKD